MRSIFLPVIWKNNCGVEFFEAENYKEAIKHFNAGAELGDTLAQYNLGICYFYGRGVKKNFKEAVYWFKLAAEQGETDAQLYLGSCYLQGKGVPKKNFKLAARWIKKAAQHGRATAQCWMGIYNSGGKGMLVDSKEAVKWFKLAAEQGDAQAQFNLGKCNEKGFGVHQDYIEAVKWFKLAANQGFAEAKEALETLLYPENNQVIQDDVKHNPTIEKQEDVATKLSSKRKVVLKDKIARLEARIKKEKALLNKSTRKKRDNYLFAFGVAIEELYKKATTDEERNQIKKQVCGALIDRTLDRAVKGFEILDLEFPLKKETEKISTIPQKNY